MFKIFAGCRNNRLWKTCHLNPYDCTLSIPCLLPQITWCLCIPCWLPNSCCEFTWFTGPFLRFNCIPGVPCWVPRDLGYAAISRQWPALPRGLGSCSLLSTVSENSYVLSFVVAWALRSVSKIDSKKNHYFICLNDVKFILNIMY